MVRFDTSASTKHGPLMNQMIMGPVDIPARRAPFPRTTWMRQIRGWRRFSRPTASKEKSRLTVALARSSLSSTATEPN